MLGSEFKIKVDITNPGQFFACCGLFELAHRLWPGVEGYFDTQAGMFIFPCKSQENGIELLKKLRECPLEGLSDAERQELKSLETRKQELKKQKKKLDPQEEKRRKALGDKARSGRLTLGKPFSLLLDWWQTEDETTPKTWAGKQEIHKIARAAQEALSPAVINNPEDILDYACVLRSTREYVKKSDENKKVAPFYFDARSFVHSLDTGFSLDVQELELMAYPAVELLALVGLQRFRPAAQGQDFDYWIWTHPMPALVAAAIVCGAASAEASIRYRFRLRFRDDRGRYKAFEYANLI
ncbi:MAG: type I-U CRISPR-associated protein Cas8c [Chloroflexus sp.]|nr:type I-U CRISPR-associated protein Cas8c [Chloroflexus sp.]